MLGCAIGFLSPRTQIGLLCQIPALADRDLCLPVVSVVLIDADIISPLHPITAAPRGLDNGRNMPAALRMPQRCSTECEMTELAALNRYRHIRVAADVTEKAS